MMQHRQSVFAFDIHIRRDVDETAFPSASKCWGKTFRKERPTRRTGENHNLPVDHGPVRPAYGFRLDYGGYSVALSGDTRPSDKLVKFCRGVDVLIHEVLDPEVLRKQHPSEQLSQAIVRHHTTPEQAGSIFARVEPR